MAKASRRATKNQKSSKAHKKGSKASRKHRGGGLSPADINDKAMLGPSNLSMGQGKEYLAMHAGQHGGAGYQYANQAAPGYTGVLDSSLRGSAHLLPADASWAAASGMSDQAGGGRKFSWKSLQKRFGNSFRKVKSYGAKLFAKKGKKSRKSALKSIQKRFTNSFRKVKSYGAKFFAKKGKSRKQRGGAADYSSSSMLLPSDMQAKALAGMHPDWAAAK